MTKLHFEKWQATGNDFIIMDFSQGIPADIDQDHIARWCDRKFGIGADGFMYLDKHPDLAFDMHYFNADGLEAEMCGNGARSILGFAHQKGLIGSSGTFQAIDGPHTGFVLESDQYRIKMVDVTGFQSLKIPGIDQMVAGSFEEAVYLNTGVPHLVIFVKDVSQVDVFRAGKTLRWDHQFAPFGTNVNFVQIHADHIRIRTYERGVENETLSCGTGATAAAIASAIRYDLGKHQKVKVEGGELTVSFNKTGPNEFNEIFLAGQALKVFEGEINYYD